MEWLEYIYIEVKSFVTGVGNIFSYIFSFFETLWYGLTTMLSGLFDMIVELFNSGLF